MEKINDFEVIHLVGKKTGVSTGIPYLFFESEVEESFTPSKILQNTPPIDNTHKLKAQVDLSDHESSDSSSSNSSSDESSSSSSSSCSELKCEDNDNNYKVDSDHDNVDTYYDKDNNY